VKAENSK
jgi:hypothetical protein